MSLLSTEIFEGHVTFIFLKKLTTTAGFEPARAEPKRFLIFRLNHSAKLPNINKNSGLIILRTSIGCHVI